MTNVNTAALREMLAKANDDYTWESEQAYFTALLQAAPTLLDNTDRLAALEAGMRGLVEEWRGESHYTLSFRCGMQLAADELAALLNRPADGGE